MISGDPLALAKLSLCDLVRALSRGDITSQAATIYFLDRLEGAGRAFKALSRLDRDKALDQAAKSDRRRQEGEKLGPLEGLPLAHKDMFYRAGEMAHCGSRAFSNHRPTTTARVLKRLDRAGALDIARLNMVEFALGVTGDNEMTGMPLNPWDKSRIPGGSSSGSAVAVAAGLIPAALGSDTGGSVRLPAACCGLVGLKTTKGRLSTRGTLPLSFTLDTIGPLTRSCSGAAALFRVLAEKPHAQALGLKEPSHAGLKIGWSRNYFFDGLEAGTLAAIEAVAARLQALGCEIVPLYLPAEIERYNEWAVQIIATEGALFHSPWIGHEGIGRQTRRRLLQGRKLAPADYFAAVDAREEARRIWREKVWSQVDLLLTPILTGEVPRVADLADPDGQDFLDQVLALARCSRPVNLLGHPALVMPCEASETGIPTAFQLVGPDNGEERLLSLGEAFEESRGPVTYPIAA
jgi:aspartyl-tRNA(Asn)/glutamyl-tRNA(Gln) amidotransferase subunit A